WELGPAEAGSVKAAVSVAGTLLLGFVAVQRTRGRAPGRVADGLLGALGALAAACWWNLGSFHHPGFGHASETYHYLVGAKYFPELGYANLYRCTAIADAESGRRAEVEGRYARDLDTHLLVPAAELLREPERCKERFSPERWRAFRRDVAAFRGRLPRASAARALGRDAGRPRLQRGARLEAPRRAPRAHGPGDAGARPRARAPRPAAARGGRRRGRLGLRLAHALRGAPLLGHELSRALRLGRRGLPAPARARGAPRRHRLPAAGAPPPPPPP